MLPPNATSRFLRRKRLVAFGGLGSAHGAGRVQGLAHLPVEGAQLRGFGGPEVLVLVRGQLREVGLRLLVHPRHHGRIGPGQPGYEAAPPH
ncbi:hypothetical protein LJ737_24945, partial [Hymenobacter sp. 15J16-1T3B]|nr:hypothetical protein [Hymenobacter sp. 15J16-1T3B]